MPRRIPDYTPAFEKWNEVSTYGYMVMAAGMANKPTVEMDLPNVAEAKCEAARYLGRMVCEEAAQFWESGELSLIVCDDKGLVLFTLDMIARDAPALRIEIPQRI